MRHVSRQRRPCACLAVWLADWLVGCLFICLFDLFCLLWIAVSTRSEVEKMWYCMWYY